MMKNFISNNFLAYIHSNVPNNIIINTLCAPNVQQAIVQKIGLELGISKAILLIIISFL
jgi:hypothetical protein